MVYQKRLLLYADILGWSAEIRSGDGKKALNAVKHIQRRTDEINERVREELKEQGNKMHVRTNQMFLEVQFGAFSDHFVWSLPEAFSYRILNIASRLILDLLHSGFLTRGAVVLNDLYHRDNVIFGPALLEAVEIEENESFYPRLLVSDNAVAHCSRLFHGRPFTTMIKDQTGRFVINPFSMPIDGPDEVIESFIKENFCLSDIKSTINTKILTLKKQKYIEKWRYLDQFITGQVFDSEPALRRFWQ
jgi:hypothetical protein